MRGWLEGGLLALDVPIRSQFDSSEYQASNCGPTSLAMVLEGFGLDLPTADLRALANRLQGTFDRENGIALDHLASIARQSGLRSLGPRIGWTVDDVRREVRHGHPVITLAKMRALPDHAASTAETDHYVVVVGLDGDSLLINDPAMPGESGFRRPLTHAQLEAAWAASSMPRQALALAAAEGVAEIALADPLTFAAPTPAPATATPIPAPPVPALAQQPIVIIITPPAPQAPPVIVINVPASQPMPTAPPPPTPIPTVDRWSRPGRVVAEPVETPLPTVNTSWVPRMPDEDSAVVLGETTPTPGSPMRWPLRLGILGAAAALIRRVLR